MKLLQYLKNVRKKSAALNSEAFYTFLHGNKSTAGPSVNLNTAMQCAAVLGCVKVIAEDIGKLPRKIYKRDEEDERRRTLQRKNSVYKLIAVKPNAWMTPQQFFEALTASAALTGGGFAIKTRSPITDDVLELIPVLPQLVEIIQQDNLEVIFRITLRGGKKKDFLSKDIFYLPGACLTGGFIATNTLKQAREIIGLSLSYEEYQASMSAKGVTPPGILKTDQVLTSEQVMDFVKIWKEKFGGSLNGGETPAIGGGFEYQQIGLNGRDAQQIENRKFQIPEICRAFRVHPNKIFGNESTQTYASSEQFAVDHVGDTIMPWAVRWEQAIDRQLLSEEEIEEGYYSKLPLQGLMRGDSAARIAYYKGMREITAVSVNDIRALEDMDIIDEPPFNDPRLPLNTNPLPKDSRQNSGDSNDAAQN